MALTLATIGNSVGHFVSFLLARCSIELYFCWFTAIYLDLGWFFSSMTIPSSMGAPDPKD